MTKKRASATDELRHVEPVSSWTNQDVSGNALCAEHVWQENRSRIEDLRSRQRNYLDSLPTNPGEVIDAALRIMHPDGEEYPDGVEEAMHLACALEAMVRDGDLGAQGRFRDAAIYVSERVTYALHRATRQLDKMSDVLGNRDRIERASTGKDGYPMT